MARRIIYWFRNDLRLDDNEALHAAIAACDEIIPVYVFDPRQFETTKLGFKRTGTLRSLFLLETVENLRENIRARGGDLLIRLGEPEKIVAELAEEFNASHVFASKEIAPQETRMESSLSKNLKINNVDFDQYWMDTLIGAEKLPFSIAKLPVNFTSFQNQIGSQIVADANFPAPEKFNLPDQYEAGGLPAFDVLKISENDLAIIKPATKGGETEGLAALADLKTQIDNGNPIGECREILIQSHLSDWLAVGCLSPATIYTYLCLGENKTPVGTKILKNLLSRDYFNWTLLKYGPRMFKPSGVTHTFEKQWANDQAKFRQWSTGQTANEHINQLVRTLNETGHLPLPDREELASYLADTLNVNWTWGAMFYESRLLDYKVAINWGRWNNISGVGKS